MVDIASPPPKGNILVIDDTPANLHLLAEMLSKQGYCVRLSPSASLALKSIQAVPPDLILLDIRMPEMNGYEVCTALKANPATRDIPIIFLSALQDSIDKVKAFSVGGADYVPKPFEAAEVLARIEHHLQLQRLRNQLIAQQEQLIAQNEELARSNRELEQFAYVVSHDLQQPLQGVTGFVKLILMKSGDSLDTSTQEYLQQILDSGKQMQRLIQDLLTYAKVGKSPRVLEPVDCNAILTQVLTNLRMIILEKQAIVVADALPIVQGDEIQLMQLFQNLIANAIKFVSPGTIPQVKISVQPQDQSWCFGIHDNGIGIAPEHLKRIFEAFHRLNNTRQYPGSGIGLATCKKIVENQDGRIWVESRLGVGTTVYFTLKQRHHPT
ncbi:ATP-binding protein [Pantanalinema rosaneae CENA516]|uniref:ATP-binding protein n=1 Tax=Pantanalinema rosaneae TaxID=1620701 RepID=UPI003D6E0EF8